DQTDSSGFNTGSTFHPNDFAAALGYSYTIPFEGPMEGVSFGVAGKYIQSTITKTASTFAGDLGFLSPAIRLLNRDFRVSYSVQNLGGQLKFQQAGDPLPLNLRLGTSYTLTNDWLLAIDINE